MKTGLTLHHTPDLRVLTGNSAARGDPCFKTLLSQMSSGQASRGPRHPLVPSLLTPEICTERGNIFFSFPKFKFGPWMRSAPWIRAGSTSGAIMHSTGVQPRVGPLRELSPEQTCCFENRLFTMEKSAYHGELQQQRTFIPCTNCECCSFFFFFSYFRLSRTHTLLSVCHTHSLTHTISFFFSHCSLCFSLFHTYSHTH